MSETLKILEMLDQGTITVEEANQLLEAAQEGNPQAAEHATDVPLALSPNMQRFRHFSYIPFGVSLLLLLLIGWGTYALSRQADGRITAGFVVMLILLVLILVITVLTFAMTRAPWLHVRVQGKTGGDSEDGPKRKGFAISLPVPVTLGQWGLRVAQRFVGEEQRTQLDMAASLLRSVKHDLGKPGTDPIVVDVDDTDEHVQIYIG